MRIGVLGLRGFPDVQGGVEKHCENLYPALVQRGCEVIVFTRAPYVDTSLQEYKGVRLIPLKCLKNKFLEAFLHTFCGIFAAKKYRLDLLHIHAVGPSLMVPIARLLGFKVVMTHHGPDYERKKWNKFAKIILKSGEYLGIKFANQVIAISESIAEGIRKKYGRQAAVIPNGVLIPEILKSDSALVKYGLEKQRYILAVGRFVSEKGFPDLIDAFGELKLAGLKLVIAGSADHEDKYSLSLKEKAGKNKDIVLTGFLTGRPLAELYSHARLFVLPSYYEGLPIVLLEAMSYGLSCVVSDIPANKNVGLNNDRFFKAGDIKALAFRLREFIDKPIDKEERIKQLNVISESYDWRTIADKTLEVYRNELSDKKIPGSR